MNSLNEIEREIKLLGREKIKNELIKFDDDFYKNKRERRKNNLISRGWVVKTFQTDYGEFRIRIRKYLCLKTKKYCYPVYENFGYVRYSKFNNCFKNRVVNEVISDKLSYQKVVNRTDNLISKSTINRWILKMKIKDNTSFKVDNLEKKKEIFICLDDTFRCCMVRKKKKKYRFRVVYFYQMNENKVMVNKHKLVILSECNQSKISTDIVQIKLILKEKYQYCLYHQKLIFCGDGAKFIKKIAKNFENHLIVLDKFHCFKSIQKVFNFRNNDRSLRQEETIIFNKEKRKWFRKIRQLISENNFKQVYESLNNASIIFKNNKLKLTDLEKLKHYLMANQEEISNWNLFSFNPCITESIVQEVVKNNFGAVGKIFTIGVLARIISFKAEVCLV